MNKFVITTAEMEIAVANYFGVRQNLIVPNISWGLDIHECDLLICSKSGYLTEVEIKISKSDLIKDKEKRHGHYNQRIKALYFAIPDYLYTEEIIAHIPNRAGILTVRYNGKRFVVLAEREAEKSKGIAMTESEKFNMARLGALRIWNLKRKNTEHKANYKAMKERIKELENKLNEQEKA